MWLAPDNLDEAGEVLRDESAQAGAVITMQGRPCFDSATKDAEFVRWAWKFDEINRRYRDYIDFATEGIARKAQPGAARDWVREESSRWKQAVRFDPLLPDELLPDRYLGKKAWRARRALLKKAVPMSIALQEE